MAAPININKIKQILQKLAKDIESAISSRGADASEPKLASRIFFPIMREGRTIPQDVGSLLYEAVEEIAQITEPSGVWSNATVDDVVSEFTQKVADLAPDEREWGRQAAMDHAMTRFCASASPWVVDILVYGLHENCGGVTFGRVQFISEDITATADERGFTNFPKGVHVLGRCQTTAIDEDSAVESAKRIIDEHLLILNALCSQREWPSYIQVSRVAHEYRSYYAVRCSDPAAPPGFDDARGHES